MRFTLRLKHGILIETLVLSHGLHKMRSIRVGNVQKRLNGNVRNLKISLAQCRMRVLDSGVHSTWMEEVPNLNCKRDEVFQKVTNAEHPKTPGEF